MKKSKIIFTTLLLLIVLIKPSYCKTYLNAVNSRLVELGYKNPVVIPTNNNMYLLNDDAMNYTLVYAQTLNDIEYEPADYTPYFIAGAFILGFYLGGR